MSISQRTKKTSAISFRVAPELKEAAEQAAAEDSRTVASLVEKLLKDYLRAKDAQTVQPGER